MDIDADGINDILSGCYSQKGHEDMVGSFWILKGLGEGKFAKAAELMGTDGKLLRVHAKFDDRNAQLTENICTRPFAVDWDGDGDLDIVSGNFKGTFYLFTGEGKGKFQPQAVALKTADGKDLKASGVHSDPFVIDWDSDGDLDLVATSSTGEIAWAENTAETGAPKLSSFRTLIARPGSNVTTPQADADYAKAIGETYKLLEEGKFDEADVAFSKVIESAPAVPDGYYHLACSYSRRASSLEGDLQKEQIARALKMLGAAVEKGWTGIEHMQGDPDMDLLRGLDEYAEIVKKIAQPKQPAGPAGSTRMWITDVNGDGRQDILVGDRFSSGGQARPDLTKEEQADYQVALKEQTDLQKAYAETYAKYREEYDAAVKAAETPLTKEEQAKLWREMLAEPERKAFMQKYSEDMKKLSDRLAKYKQPYVAGGHVWLFKARAASPSTGK